MQRAIDTFDLALDTDGDLPQVLGAVELDLRVGAMNRDLAVA